MRISRYDELNFFQSTCLHTVKKAPVLEIVSNARPSLFAYPSPTKPPAKEAVEKVATAVLSTTAKAKQRAKEKKEKGDAIEMVSDEQSRNRRLTRNRMPNRPRLPVQERMW